MEKFLKENLEKIISIIVILLIVYILNLTLNKIINKIIKKRKNKNLTTILLFIKKLKSFIIYLIGILICLSKFEMFSSLSVTLLGAIGIATTILGLAAQEILKNFFGSLELIISHPFEVGDLVEISEKGITGVVEELSIRDTVIKTFDNGRQIIPNSVLNNLCIKNFHHTDSEICLFAEYPVAYEADIVKATDILKEEITKLYHPKEDGLNKDVEFPKVRVVKWDSSAIVIRAWVWGEDSGNAYENMFSLNYNLKKRFNEEGIEIPYDHVNVILDQNKDRN